MANSPKPELTADDLRSILSYDEQTGVFVWRIQCGRKNAGEVAGWNGRGRYVQIGIKRKLHYAHRLAWLYVHGRWPHKQLDHINGNPLDNRMENLRECSNAENCQNLGLRKSNTSGVTGVTWDRFRAKWKAQIRENGKVRGIGRYETFEEAHAAYLNAKKIAHQFQPTPRGLS